MMFTKDQKPKTKKKCWASCLVLIKISLSSNLGYCVMLFTKDSSTNVRGDPSMEITAALVSKSLKINSLISFCCANYFILSTCLRCFFLYFFSDILFTFLRCVPSCSSFCIASQSFGNDLSFHNVSLPACTSPKWLTLLLFLIQFLLHLTFSVKTFPKIVLLLLND